MEKDRVVKGLFAIALGAAAIMGATPAAAFFDRENVDPAYGATKLARAVEGSGPLAPESPKQVEIEERFEIPWGEYRIEGTHGIGVEAIVLSAREYREGDMGALVPMDLALAWGPVSDPAWIKHLKVSQSDRLYRWSFPRGTALTAESVTLNSANMHIMPASPEILGQLQGIKKGDLVRLSGFLVNISGPDSFEWKTSLVRDDAGRGSCELILLENIEIVRD